MKKMIAIAMAAAMAVGAVCAVAEEVSPKYSINMEDEQTLMNGTLSIGAAEDDVTEKDIWAGIYDEIRYDAAEIDALKVGDLIDCQQQYTITSVEKDDSGCVDINGGFDNDGLTLYPEDDGTYTPREWDDLPYYEMMGQAQLQFADQVTVNHYKENEDGGLEEGMDTQTVDAAQVKGLIFGEYSHELDPAAVTVTLENGLITEVTVNYIP